jgi:hypothetical protein
MELNRVIRDCDEKEILTPRQRAVSVRLLAAGGRLHDVVANEAKQFVDLDIWRGSGCDRPELLVYFVMSASSAIFNALPRHDAIARRAGMLPLCLTALRFPQFQIERLQKTSASRECGRVLRVPPEAIFPR